MLSFDLHQGNTNTHENRESNELRAVFNRTGSSCVDAIGEITRAPSLV